MRLHKAKYLSAIVLSVTVLFSGSLFAEKATLEDQRILVNLDERDQQLFLIEMRAVLETISSIMAALDANNMDAVAKAAAGSKVRIKSKSKELLKKLPADFRVFSKSVRKGFMQISKAAKSGASKEKIITQLSGQLGRCVACHATYRIR